MKFNIAFVPNSQDVGYALIALANEISANLKPAYLLKDTEQLSIPHASVIQFEIDNNIPSPEMFGNNNHDPLQTAWKIVTKTWQEIITKNNNNEVICTLLQSINYKHDLTGAFAGITWAEIVIDKNANPLIEQFHEQLYLRLAPLGITCLNASGECYKPHFTLFNIPTSSLEQVKLVTQIPESYFTILKNFTIRPALGLANNKWEFTKKLQEAKTSVNQETHVHTCNRTRFYFNN